MPYGTETQVGKFFYIAENNGWRMKKETIRGGGFSAVVGKESSVAAHLPLKIFQANTLTCHCFRRNQAQSSVFQAFWKTNLDITSHSIEKYKIYYRFCSEI